MKVILSRKGFDSQYGRGPSPILPDGRLLSLPIPFKRERISYRELKLEGGKTYLGMMEELGYRGFQNRTCHLDPDIYRNAIKRLAGWKPVFGQIGAAQGHLDNQGIDEGDIFLFFGWLRQTKYDDGGRLTFDPSDKVGKHVVFGYLQTGEKVRLRSDTSYPDWMAYHPHTKPWRTRVENNTVYIARDALSWDHRLPGAGTFCYNPNPSRLVLGWCGR